MLSLRSLLLLTVFAACSAKPVTQPWKLELTSSGGFTGRGVGSFTLDSTGAAVTTTLDGRTCTLRVPDATVQKIASALATRTRWTESYMPKNQCCDRVTWTMKIDVGGVPRTLRWMERSKDMPRELNAAIEVLEKLRGEHPCR